MILFFALIGIAVAISGLLGFLFFWAMAQVHLRDRLESPGAAATLPGLGFAAPRSIAWLLAGRYRDLGDRALDGLALPAQVCLWSAIAGLAAAAALVAMANLS